VGVKNFGLKFNCNEAFLAIADLFEVCPDNPTIGGCGGVYIYDCSPGSPSFGTLVKHLSSPDPLSGCQFGTFIYFWNNQLIVGQQGFWTTPSRPRMAGFFEYDPSHGFRNIDSVYTHEVYYAPTFFYNSEVSQEASYVRAIGLDGGKTMDWPYIIKLEPARHRTG
jgi:hypothetical protein